MKTEQDNFLDTIMLMPRKPEFIGFTMNTEDLYQQMVRKLNEIVDTDLSDYCSYDHSDDNEFLFYIDYDTIQSDLEDADDILAALPFDYEYSWEASQYLVGRVFGVDTWAYAQVQPHDSSMIDVQIGLPRNL